jgi:hypothetical protein
MNPTFRAEIRLLATQEGGRRGPLVSGEWRTVLGYEHFAKGVEFTVWEGGTKAVGRVLTDAA